MKIIELKEAGHLDPLWFWNESVIFRNSYPFHRFLSFIENPDFPTLYINSDLIVELKDGYPTTYLQETEYVKRNWFMELFFGKKEVSTTSCIRHENKVTWIKLSDGKTYYVVESVEQIKRMLEK